MLTLPAFIAKYAPSLPPLDLEGFPDGDRIRRTLVSPSKSLQPEPGIKKASRSQSLEDLMDEVIWSLVQRKSRDWSQRNVLDQGYSVSSAIREHLRTCPNMRPGVVCKQINDNVNFCKTSPYAESLYRLVGDDLMRILLLNTSVFLPVEGSEDNYILLCGMARSNAAKGRSTKKTRSSDDNSGEENGWKANDFISRQSMFYSHAHVPKIGLQTGHVMNQNDPNKLLSTMVNLYTSNGKKRRKRWKRLRDQAVPMCKEILYRHQRFDYHRTLNRCCPLPRFAKLGKKAQVDLVEVGAAHTPVDFVALFLEEIIRKVFSLDVWGSQHNLERVISMLATFVALRRGERFPNKALTEGLRVTDIRWLWTTDDNSKSGHEAATTMLREVMRWILCSFTIPLLRSIFYVTESEFSAKRVLFYRKPVWSIFRSLSIKKLTTKQYREISQKETAALLEAQQMGLSRLKLLPKATGVRPIAMLSKRDTLVEHESKRIAHLPSTNAALAATFEVLRHEYERKPQTFGVGQVGVNGVYPILKSFLAKVRSEEQPWTKKTKKKLYFVSVDIQKCYDNVNQQYLQKIVQDIVQDDQYLIQRHSVLHPYSSLGRPVWKKLRLVGPLQKYEGFHELSAKLSPNYTEAVFSNGMGCSITKKQDVMKQLAEHLQSNLVAMPGRYGKRYFLQTCGIPQGSVLSSFLCNFYYGRMETEILGDILDDSSASTLIRIMDDFIFMTTDRSQAALFLERMKQGKPELGVSINTDKTLSNLGQDATGEKQLISMSGSTFFTWCGLLIDTATGEVRIDYSRFANTKAVDALTVDRCQVGKNLEIRMKTFVRPRCQPILFDAKINSFDVIMINFTQMMLLAALKSQEFIRSVINVEKNVGFIRQAIESTVSFARNLIIHRLRQQADNDASFCVGQQDAIWLGRRAFQYVFKQSGLCVLAVEANRPGREQRTSRLNRAAQIATTQFITMTTNTL